MLISIQNVKTTSISFNTHTGKMIMLEPAQSAVVNCPDGYFSYYTSLRYYGFELSTDDVCIVTNPPKYATVEVIKEVEKIVEVPVAVIREVIKEVPVVKEIVVEKTIEVEKRVEVPVEVIKEVPVYQSAPVVGNIENTVSSEENEPIVEEFESSDIDSDTESDEPAEDININNTANTLLDNAETGENVAE